jgi:hypothetical protein
VNEGETFYTLLRLAFSVVGAIAMAVLFRRSISLARRAHYADQRLFIATVVFMLALVTLLLGFTAVWDWQRPPPTDGVLAIFGMATRAVLAIGAVVLVWKWPWDREAER